MIKRYTKQDILDTAEDYRELGKADEQKRILEIIDWCIRNGGAHTNCLKDLKEVIELKAKIKEDGK